MTENRKPLQPWTKPLIRHPVNVRPLSDGRAVITWDNQIDTVYPTLEDAVSYLKSIERRYIIHDN